MSEVAEQITRRETCARCHRPMVTCYCAHLRPQETRTQVIVLQHPREERVAIGTAHMAHLGLVGSILRVGLDFSDDAVVNAALAARPDRYVLFPGEGASDVDALPADRAITLVVLDGTWWQAKKLLTLNPQLAALPRVAFRPRNPSNYRIRKQPEVECVSTIEAIAEVLGRLEGGADARAASLLAPFQAMVDTQIRYTESLRASRHAHHADRPRRPLSARVADRLRAAWPQLVCVHGDANGWPVRHPSWQPAELVHWVASRPATDERFEAVLAPRKGLAPDTAQHIGVDEATLRGGLSVAAAGEAWRAFRREDDVLVHFGPFSRNLADAERLALPPLRFDLRDILRQLDPTQRGGLEMVTEALGITAAPVTAPGRAGRRLSLLVALLERLAAA